LRLEATFGAGHRALQARPATFATTQSETSSLGIVFEAFPFASYVKNEKTLQLAETLEFEGN